MKIITLIRRKYYLLCQAAFAYLTARSSYLSVYLSIVNGNPFLAIVTQASLMSTTKIGKTMIPWNYSIILCCE